ncbi:hypothetical protein CNMCM6805_003673 [Aspergillus fumigatiaffinis]|uniref:Ankyrin repeat protein n=1 Tax=Aspergillus fumigatiaffinis TaxID=340414 RepID=A0A8H4M3K9_9EURO|nr:hypothetical protein CNMCM6457_003664 [Aspergillus fumigatiaffinis]KAF4227044.1 hypothetical protein CNMCM6805_003673 [Aspergillus fumigatiaffinis]
MAHFMDNPAQMVVLYTLLMVLSIASATSELVGCGTLECDCQVENRTLSALGQASFNSSYIGNGTMPLTWTLGLQENTGPRPAVHRPHRPILLSRPATKHMTTLFQFKFVDPENATCPDIMGAGCVRDLISLAKQEASPDSSMSKNQTLDTEGFCRELAVALFDKAPKSCDPLWLGRSQEGIHVDALTGPSASQPIADLGACRPSTGKNYSVSMVESYRWAVSYENPDLNMTLHGVTPVMTLFYPNSLSSQQAMPVDVHLSCLTTPLHQAVRKGDERMVKALINAGADVSAQDNSARTALHLACEAEEAGIVQLLLDDGADPSTADYNGRTPLHEAVGRDTIILQKLLRRDGVDLNPREMLNGLTPLFYEASLGRKDAFTELIYYGADADICSVNGETVLQRATLGNHADIVRLLLDRGVNINVRDSHGYTAVLVAAIAGANECLQLLLKAGADISVVDNYGRNALHIAAWNGRKSTVRLLLRKGVDPKALDNRGSCALCWAVQRRHDGLIRILKHAQKNPVSRFIATLPSFPWRGRGKKFCAPVSILAVAHHHHSA